MAAGERRTAIEKIEHKSSRQVTFSKRRKGLFHKAEDYADVCHAEIAVIVFSNTNRLYVFSSTSMQQILSRYVNYRGDVVAMDDDDDDDESPEKSPEHEVVKQDSRSSSQGVNAMVLLEEEGRALNLDCSRLAGRKLDGISLEELNDLERRIREGIEFIQKRKTQVQKNYCEYKPSYVLEYPHHYLDRSNSQIFVGSSSSGVSDCSESEKSDDRIDTSLRL